MFSDVQAFEAGTLTWSVERDADKAPDDVVVIGIPPEPFQSIREALIREQDNEEGADVIFEIPIALAGALTGFRPDEDLPGPPPEFVQVVRTGKSVGAPGPFGWLKRLFGGGRAG